MVKLVEEKGLRFLPAPNDYGGHPSLPRMRALRDAVRCERPDLLHVWDWWQCLDAYYAVYLPMRVPMVVTDMMMSLTRVLPKELPTTFGTPEVLDQAKAAGRRQVELLLPPVDIHSAPPNAVDSLPFRERYGIGDGDITLVTVSRLADSMKAESLIRTVHAVRKLGRDLPLRFVIVGDGAIRAKLEQLADQVNMELGRPAVVLAGRSGTLGQRMPRPTSSSAWAVQPCGGMAFGKSVIIVGEQGFSAPFTPETAESFYYKGIYGLGNDSPGNARLVADIRGLAEHPAQRSALGQFSRQFVVRRFSMEVVCARLEEFCRGAVTKAPKLHVIVADGLRTAAVCLRERSRPMAMSSGAESEYAEVRPVITLARRLLVDIGDSTIC